MTRPGTLERSSHLPPPSCCLSMCRQRYERRWRKSWGNRGITQGIRSANGKRSSPPRSGTDRDRERVGMVRRTAPAADAQHVRGLAGRCPAQAQRERRRRPIRWRRRGIGLGSRPEMRRAVAVGWFAVLLSSGSAWGLTDDLDTSPTQPAAALVAPFDSVDGMTYFAVTQPPGGRPVATHWVFWSDGCDHLVDVWICLTAGDTVIVDSTSIQAIDDENQAGGPVVDLSGERGSSPSRRSTAARAARIRSPRSRSTTCWSASTRSPIPPPVRASGST